MNINEIIDNPLEIDFFQMVYYFQSLQENTDFSRGFGDTTLVGYDGPFKKEPIQFSNDASLGFEGLSVSKIKRAEHRWQLLVTCMGLIGGEGVLPGHYTELVQERIKARDYAFLDFLDIFNHRLLSLFYRSWEKYNVAIVHGRARRNNQIDDFSQCVNAISGNAHNSDIVNYYAGFFSSPIRSASALELMLNDYLSVPVTVEQFSGRWLDIELEEQCQLNANRKDLACLGETVMLGKKYWSVQNKINLKIGPLNYEQYCQFIPGQQKFDNLKKLASQFVGPAIEVEYSLLVNERQITPMCKTSKPLPLGHSTWLGGKTDLERYVEFS